MVAVANPFSSQPSEDIIPPICAAYSILMKTRDAHLSAFQRLTSAILIKGHADDEVMYTNKLSFHTSVSLDILKSNLRRFFWTE